MVSNCWGWLSYARASRRPLSKILGKYDHCFVVIELWPEALFPSPRKILAWVLRCDHFGVERLRNISPTIHRQYFPGIPSELNVHPGTSCFTGQKGHLRNPPGGIIPLLNLKGKAIERSSPREEMVPHHVTEEDQERLTSFGAPNVRFLGSTVRGAVRGIFRKRGTGVKSIRKITISFVIQELLREPSSADVYHCAEFVTGQLSHPPSWQLWFSQKRSFSKKNSFSTSVPFLQIGSVHEKPLRAQGSFFPH